MKIIKYFHNTKFRFKLLITYMLIGILPITIIGVIWYSNTRKVLVKQEKNNIQNYLNQAVSNMDNQLRIYDNLSDYIVFNQTISHVVSHNYDSYYDMYNQFSNVIDPMLSSIKYFHKDINQVTIYGENNIVKHDTTLAPISEIQNESWYSSIKDDSQIHWIISKLNKSAISVRNIPTIQKDSKIGVLYVNVNYNKLFESFNNMNDSNYGIVIIDENENNIFELAEFDYNNENMKLTYEELTKEMANKGEYTIVECNSTNENWKIILYKPEKLVYESINSMFLGTVMVVVIFIILAFLVASIVSRIMVSDIEKLRENMEEIENGNMEIKISSNRKDEIGTLIRGFGKMINQIKSLIEDVYESKLIKKDYEMRALQAQINPHFLYNSLSLINWMALEVNQKQISQITLNLSAFYRTALNKGKNIMSVRDEIQNMKSYIDIQLMMHDYEFDVDIQIDDEILDYQILNLLLQPLIENSIDHGIDLKTDGRGIIHILGTKEYKDVVLIVADNGVGMEQDKIDTILTNQSKGYGVKNVNERIKLFYGAEYELHIESEVGIGTQITVRIPAQKIS